MRYFSSSTGQKFLMAVSGLILLGFVISHLLGNLQIFLGPEALNKYSAYLKGVGGLLWVARMGLLIMVVIHIWTAVAITLQNRAARPAEYAQKEYIEASYASRTMHLSGFIVLAYLIYHLLHFTFGTVHPEYAHFMDAQGRYDVYRMVVVSFQQPMISLVYIVANLLLGMHVSHGIYSAFQSLGFVSEGMRGKLKTVSFVTGYAIFLGYAAIPLSVLLGWVRLP
jgi:succinate dehydrogenase / fumarate reductase, cytochrome b subunit